MFNQSFQSVGGDIVNINTDPPTHAVICMVTPGIVPDRIPYFNNKDAAQRFIDESDKFCTERFCNGHHIIVDLFHAQGF